MSFKDRYNRFQIRLKMTSAIRDLRHNTKSTVAPLLANALRTTVQENPSLEEIKWLERIEGLRSRLCASEDELTIVDYGAGSIFCNFTEEERRQTKIVTRTVGDICEKDCTPYFWSLLLFNIVRALKPSVCLELGTCLGISAAYQAAALKLNNKGRVVTLEGAETYVTMAREHFRSLGLDNVVVMAGRFRSTLEKALNKYQPVDFVFVDGHHDEEATVNYFEQILPHASEKAVMIIDDISWSKGMRKAWRKIRSSKKIAISVDMSNAGIVIVKPS